jgi:hypothetical protein
MVKQGGMIKSWKRRLFVLDSNGVLSYFKSDPDLAKAGTTSSPSGTINTAACTMLKIDAEPATILWPGACASARCGIVLRTQSRTYAMYAESKANALRWAQLLSMTAKLCAICGLSCFARNGRSDAGAALDAESPASGDGFGGSEVAICLEQKWFFHTTCFACNVKKGGTRPDVRRKRREASDQTDDGTDRKGADSDDGIKIEENWFYYSPATGHDHKQTAAAAAAATRSLRNTKAKEAAQRLGNNGTVLGFCQFSFDFEECYWVSHVAAVEARPCVCSNTMLLGWFLPLTGITVNYVTSLKGGRVDSHAAFPTTTGSLTGV